MIQSDLFFPLVTGDQLAMFISHLWDNLPSKIFITERERGKSSTTHQMIQLTQPLKGHQNCQVDKGFFSGRGGKFVRSIANFRMTIFGECQNLDLSMANPGKKLEACQGKKKRTNWKSGTPSTNQ